jgi:putative membrane protein
MRLRGQIFYFTFGSSISGGIFMMIKHTVECLIATCLAATFVQCGGDAREPETAMMPAGEAPPETNMAPASDTAAAPSPAPATPAAEAQPAPADPPAAAPAALTDEQIAAVTDAANDGEVQQAKLAQNNAKNARVKKFAAMMIQDHTQAKQKQKKLLTKLNVVPADNALATELKTGSTQKIDELKTLKAADFDRSYMDAQVDAHQKVLEAFDTRLIPNAKNAEFKALLSEIRPKIAAHLEEAKSIQEALRNAESGAADKAAPPGGAKAPSSGSKGAPSTPHH